MRDKVRFERPEKTKDPMSGALSINYALVVSRSASIRAISGGELAMNGGEITRATSIIEVRYDRSLSAISSEWRIVDARLGRIYDIEHLDPISSATKFLKIRCIHRSK